MPFSDESALWPWVCDTVLRSGPLGRDVSTLVTAPMTRVRFFAGSKASSIWSGPLLRLLADRGSREEDLTRAAFSSTFLFPSLPFLCACTSMVVRTGRDAKAAGRVTRPASSQGLAPQNVGARPIRQANRPSQSATPVTFEFQPPRSQRTSIRRGQSAPALRSRANHGALRLRGHAP